MGMQQHRKNPLPVVRAAYGNGIFLLAHGEPHDPCPVEGCAGELRSLNLSQFVAGQRHHIIRQRHCLRRCP